MLVVDASVVVAASGSERGLDELRDSDLVAPALLWSEARSALHELLWRGAIDRADAETMQARLETCAVRRVDDERLGDEAWRIADDLGWAKTYDAEYLALGRLLDCRVVTLDARLHRGARRLDSSSGRRSLA